jgi:drug/metabolite transporter (DMT)-like permease
VTRATSARLALVAGFLAVIVAFFASSPLSVTVHDALALVALGIVQIAIGLWLFLFALRRLPAAPVALAGLGR